MEITCVDWHMNTRQYILPFICINDDIYGHVYVYIWRFQTKIPENSLVFATCILDVLHD